jgi:hypothetical protein
MVVAMLATIQVTSNHKMSSCTPHVAFALFALEPQHNTIPTDSPADLLVEI